MKFDQFGITASGERGIAVGLPSWLSEGTGQWVLMAVYVAALTAVGVALLYFFPVTTASSKKQAAPTAAARR